MNVSRRSLEIVDADHSKISADVIVVGAGIVGLAHAWEAARRGLSVVVFERNTRAQGASVRNFGMVVPFVMPVGLKRERAYRSRARWLEFLTEAGVWHSTEGMMLLAYHNDEQRTIEEFMDQGLSENYAWLNSAEVLERSPVKPRGLLGALYSNEEILIDPVVVLPALTRWLEEKYNVQFCFGTAVTGTQAPVVEAGGVSHKAERIVVCCGSEIETLYPSELAAVPLKRVKLQMMSTEPQPASWQLGPFLSTGLSLIHYASFASCESVKDVRRRIESTLPDMIKWGIHLLVASRPNGQIVVGDSHVYGDDITPFDRPEIDQHILNQLDTFLELPERRLAARWHGIYIKTDNGDPLILKPAPEVRVVTGLGGGGMTTSFALAQDVFDAWQ